MSKNIMFIILLLISMNLFKDSLPQSIEGKIIDASNSDPLVEAVVKIEKTKLGAVTVNQRNIRKI